MASYVPDRVTSAGIPNKQNRLLTLFKIEMPALATPAEGPLFPQALLQESTRWRLKHRTLPSSAWCRRSCWLLRALQWSRVAAPHGSACPLARG